MSDVLEKKLGDLVRDLEAQRAELRRDLDKVNAQLELIAGLVDGNRKSSTKLKPTTPAAPKKSTGVRRGRPKKSKTVSAKATNHKAGRPAAAHAKAGSGKTLKEELFSIAKTHGGVLKVRDASQALVKSGRYSDKAQAAANIHAAIKYYNANFIRDTAARGVYRVKGSA
jgi:hypothetical protein